MRTLQQTTPGTIAVLAGVLCLSLANSALVECAAAGPASQPATSQPAGKVIGWRGDGTGRYPDATPPTEWTLNDKESKNILWKVKLPCYSWATPIIVGDKIITRSEPYDLICLDKNSGKLLWIRSHPPFTVVTADENKANPAWKEVESLVADLQKTNDDLVKEGWTKDLIARKAGLQKNINDASGKIDKKYAMPPDMYCESWSGYTGATPCSDGKNVFICSAGIIASFDLDGKLNWLRYDPWTKEQWGEHGHGCSPAVVGDVFLAPSHELLALDKKTGKEVWKGWAGGAYAQTILRAGGTDYIVGNNNVVRVRDGKEVYKYDNPGMVGSTVTEGKFFVTAGAASIYSYSASGPDDLKIQSLVKDEYQHMLFPFEGDRYDPMTNWWTASPLYDNGLLYCLSQWGKLVVVDTTKTSASDGLVYVQKMPFDMKNGKSRKSFGMGIGTSPALAGKYIYMIDAANCTIVIEPGRKYKQVAKNVIEYTVPEGWEPWHYVGPHREQTEASPIFDGNRIYIRGEQFLYCIGEK